MRLELNGHAAYAYTGGKPFDAALPCVVLIHGALNDHSVWALQSRYLAHHGRAVLALDLPGHGRSLGPSPESVEAMGAWVVDFLDAVGVAQAALAGHSMGSLVALEAAARLGERARALAMVGTAWPMAVSPALLDTALNDPERAMRQVTAFSHSTLAPKPSSPGPGAWLPGGSLALMRRMQSLYAQREGGNLFHRDFRACDGYAGAEAAAAILRCPVELVLGERDLMTPPRAAQALAGRLKAQVRLLPAGHDLMGEAPDLLLDTLRTRL